MIEGWFTQLYRRDHGELELGIRRSIKDVKSAKHRRDQAKGQCDEPPVVLPRRDVCGGDTKTAERRSSLVPFPGGLRTSRVQPMAQRDFTV